MDTEEMYERGVSDAERGELQPFYYQHYYHYRRGYDRARRQLRGPRIWESGSSLRRPLLLALGLLLLLGVGGTLLLRSRAQPAATARTPSSSAVALSATAAPTRTPIFPTATPTPAAPTLHVGGMAIVSNTEGSVLRGRREPGTAAPAQVSFKQGEHVRILEGPVEADGYTWWRIEGQGGAGWSAQQSRDQVIWLQPIDG